MTSKTLQYVLYQRKVTFGKHRGKSMQVARLTGRYQVDFERFCSLVARNTTLNYHGGAERPQPRCRHRTRLVSEGAIVDYGRLGHLMPTFKCRAVEEGEKFNPTIPHRGGQGAPASLEALLHARGYPLPQSPTQGEEKQGVAETRQSFFLPLLGQSGGHLTPLPYPYKYIHPLDPYLL